jgi:hypothetical protein
LFDSSTSKRHGFDDQKLKKITAEKYVDIFLIKNYNLLIPTGRVSDPHWLNADPDTDPDPAFFLIPDPGSGSRVWWSKIEKNLQLEDLIKFFWSKIATYLSLGLHKGRPSYRRNLQPSKENI